MRIITDALLLAVVSFLAYAYAVAFQAGYYADLDIPWDLMNVNWATLAYVAAETYSFVVIFLALAIVFYAIVRAQPDQRLYATAPWFIFAAIAAFGISLHTETDSIVALLVPLALLAIGVYFGRQRLAEGLRSLIWMIGRASFISGVLALFGFSVFIGFGKWWAHHREYFPIIGNPPQYVVVSISGDNIIAAQIVNRNPNIIQSSFKLFKVGDPTVAPLEQAIVGPLTEQWPINYR
jgi:hypothetical protein